MVNLAVEMQTINNIRTISIRPRGSAVVSGEYIV